MRKLTAEQWVKAARIELSRRSLWDFCQTIAPKFYTDDRTHLKEICDSLQALYEGRIARNEAGEFQIYQTKQPNPCKKLMLNVPPQHGKTRTLINFSDWIFGKNIEEKIITCSYNDTMASDFSRYTRDGISMPKNSIEDINYADIFPKTKIKQGNSSFEKWALQGQHFSYLGAGIGGSITGKGGTILIVDDPVKSAEDALNENNLERIWLWYTSTFRSRVSAESGEPLEIICMTRWSNRDVCGKLLESEEGKEWFVIKMKAYDETTNKMLCPSLFSRSRYLSQQKMVLPAIFHANYDQEPIENKGVLLPKSELKRFSLKEFLLQRQKAKDKKQDAKIVLGYWDIADDGSDNLCAVLGEIIGTNIYITDVIFNALGVGVTLPQSIVLLEKESPQFIRIETNNQGSIYATWLREKTKNVSIQGIKNTTNKLTRILMQEPFVKEHFYFRKEEEIIPGSEYYYFWKELTSYVKDGSMKHDDAPDAITGLSQMSRSFYSNIFN